MAAVDRREGYQVQSVNSCPMQRRAQSSSRQPSRHSASSGEVTGMPPIEWRSCGLVCQIAVRLHSEGRVPVKLAIPNDSERGLVMNQRATDTPEQVLKFAPKEKAPNRVAQLDDAGQAIVAQIRTAADLAKEDCDRAMSLAHKLSMELRAAEDRTQQMAREVEHWRDRAARAEQWLRTIQQEIEEKLLTRRSSSGGEGVAVR